MCISGQAANGPPYRLTLSASLCNGYIAIPQPSHHRSYHQRNINRNCRYSRRPRAPKLPSPNGYRKPLLCHPQTVTIRTKTRRKLRAHQLDQSYISRCRSKITVTLSRGNSTINQRLHSVNSRRKQRHKNRQLSNVRGPCVRHFPASRLVPRTKIQQQQQQQQRHITQLPISRRQPLAQRQRPRRTIAKTQRRRRATTSRIDRHRSIRANERIIVLQ